MNPARSVCAATLKLLESDAMGLRIQPAVIGCAIRPVITGRDRSLEEMIYDTAQLALADAGIGIDDIDGIVVGSNDQFDGRSISVMMASGSILKFSIEAACPDIGASRVCGKEPRPWAAKWKFGVKAEPGLR